jgi:hypothetical protein
VVQISGASYTGSNNYIVYCGSNGPELKAGDECNFEGHGANNNQLGLCTVAPKTRNPRNKWIKVEEVINESSQRNMYIDNVHAVKMNPLPNTRSYSLGGYYRFVRAGGSISSTSDYRGGVSNSNYRYFDDMYVDTTFSRVMLGNRDSYSAWTILEPQIPSAWSDSSITVTVNQGALPSGEKAYLYAFDANNNANPTGYSVEFATGAAESPSPPRTLRLRDEPEN